MDPLRRAFYPAFLDLILEQMGKGKFWEPQGRIKVNKKMRLVFIERLVEMCEEGILEIEGKREFSDIISDCFDTGLKDSTLYNQFLERFSL